MSKAKSTRICSVCGCDGLHEARGLCKRHYKSAVTNGSIVVNPRKTQRGEPLAFLNSLIGTTELGCILWPFATSGEYGLISGPGKRPIAAHRRMLLLISSPLMHNPVACHGPCHNRLCVNPNHVYWGTRSDNMNDRKRDGTGNQGSKHPLSKLTERDVIDIRKRYVAGERQRAIARHYDIDQSQISCIVTRKVWQHI